ncbi:hypothetical protein, partial [Planktothrix sp.]|uniref:hypothetical protein n=1 Tax=Planktothrix sp. TaxID=3088171 RepID=UPI0038D4175C
TGCDCYQEVAQQIEQLKETVSLLESRLSTCKNTSEKCNMNKILERIKRLIKQSEATIEPNQYGIYMACLGMSI